MAFTYETAVPWGRSFEEYCRMFRLGEQELGLKILGCADGPAGFNAQMSELGHPIVSCDPLYQFTVAQIRQRIDATYKDVVQQAWVNRDQLVWDRFRSPEDMGRERMKAMNQFLGDFGHGKREGRYIAAELPDLPFVSGRFDLALCSHFLFFYSPNFTLDFHRQALQSLTRVAKEVRIFPLFTYNAEPSPFIEPVVDTLTHDGLRVDIQEVPYEFQRGGNKMMRIYHSWQL